MERSVDETVPDGVFFLRVNAANLLLAHVVLAFGPLFFVDDPGAGSAAWIAGVLLFGLAANVPVFFLKRGRSLIWALPHVIETFLACGIIHIGVALWAFTREDVRLWTEGQPVHIRPSGTRWLLAAILSFVSSGLVLGLAGLVYLGWQQQPENQVIKDDQAHVVFDTDPSRADPVTEEYEAWAIHVDFSIWNLSDERGTPVITTEVSSTCDYMCDDQIETSGEAASEVGAKHVVIHSDCPGEPAKREEVFVEWRKLSPDATFLCQVDQGGPEWFHVPTTRVFDSLGHLRFFNDGESVLRSTLIDLVRNAETVLPSGTDVSIHPFWQGTWCGLSEGYMTIGVPSDEPGADLKAYERMRRYLGMRIEIHTELGVTVETADGERLPMGDVLYSDGDHLSVMNQPSFPAEHFGTKIHLRRGNDVYAVLVIDGEVQEWTLVRAKTGRCSNVWDGESEPAEVAGDEAEWASRPYDEWPLVVLDHEIVLNDGRSTRFGAAFLMLEKGRLAIGSARRILEMEQAWSKPVGVKELDALLETWSVFPHFQPEKSAQGTVRITTYPNGFRDAIAIGINDRPDRLPAQPLTVRDQRVRPGEEVLLAICQLVEDRCEQRPLPAVVEIVEPDRFSLKLDYIFVREGMKGAPIVDQNGELVGILTEFALSEPTENTTVFYGDFAESLQFH